MLFLTASMSITSPSSRRELAADDLVAGLRVALRPRGGRGRTCRPRRSGRRRPRGGRRLPSGTRVGEPVDVAARLVHVLDRRPAPSSRRSRFRTDPGGSSQNCLSSSGPGKTVGARAGRRAGRSAARAMTVMSFVKNLSPSHDRDRDPHPPLDLLRLRLRVRDVDVEDRVLDDDVLVPLGLVEALDALDVGLVVGLVVDGVRPRGCARTSRPSSCASRCAGPARRRRCCR